jgi:hypothetical protein
VLATDLQYEGGLQTTSGLDNFINVSCNTLQAWMHLLIETGREGISEKDTGHEDISH